jgi:outer membrane lipoprotein SlyB
MENIRGRTLMNRGMFCAVFTLLAVVIASGGPGLAQGSGDRAIGQAQRAVREQITSREGGRNLTAHFNSDARSEFKSNAEVRVRGTGVFSRNNARQSRNFSYEAVVNNRNRNVSDIRYNWRGDWYSSGGSYVTNRLTGAYRLNQSRSDNPATVADRVARNLPGGDRQRLRNSVMRRLEAPESLAIERRGRAITIASSRAAQVTFEADGREQTEQSRNGRAIRTKATLNGERLVVSTEGDRSIDYQIIFEPIDNGRSLRVTRRITDEGLRQQVVANSVYDKTSDVAQLDIYSDVRDNYPPAGASGGNFVVPDGTQLVAVLNDNLSTKQARDGDRFTLTVRSPSQYDGASIEGHVAQINRSGRVSGRAEMSSEFDRIRLRDGRASSFAGYLESVRTTGGETVRVDNEGRAQDEDSQTGRTVTRAGIGAAIGAVIGAIAGGGKGAAIGAAVGAGAGAGTVIVQGRDDLDLMSGAEFTIRASAPR